MTLLIKGAAVHRHGRPWEETDGEVLVRDGAVLGYGSPGDYSGDPPAGTRIVTLPGGRLIPAFFDAHLHLDQGGRFLDRLNLLALDDTAAVLEAVARESAAGEGLIIGIGLREDRYPALADLDRASAGRPLLLYTRDYHSLVLNTPALERFGIHGQTRFPEGGWQELDAEGRPSGVLRENAIPFVEEKLPPETKEELRGHLLRAADHLLSLGVLGVSDAGLPSSWAALRELDREGGYPLRVEQWARCQDASRTCFDMEQLVSPRLRRTRIKLFADGALGSRTAWMQEPYEDKPGWRGGPLLPEQGLEQYLREGAERGWSFTVHAIGDAAVRFVLDHLEALPAPGGAHRIEHVQHSDRETIARFARSTVIASPQPVHFVEDSGMLPARVGTERLSLAYPLRSLIGESEESLVLGTDWPVVSSDPRGTMHAALLPRGEAGVPGDELTVEQALFHATAAPATAAGFPEVGRTQPGTPADLVWLTSDPGRDPDAWREVEVGAVWRSGELVRGEVR